MIATINQAFHTYYDELPQGILPQIAKSACFSFTVSILFPAGMTNEAMDLSRPLLKGAIAALASTLHALATPLFNRMFGKVNLSVINETVKSTITAVITSAMVGCILQSSFQLTAFKLYSLISFNSVLAWATIGDNKPHIPYNSIYFCF